MKRNGTPVGGHSQASWRDLAAQLAPDLLDQVIEECRAEAASILRAKLTRALVDATEDLVTSRAPRGHEIVLPERVVDAASGWYVYGITSSSAPATGFHGVGGIPTEQVVMEDLAAVVSPIDADSPWGLGSDGDVDLDALAPKAHAHAAVLEAMLETGPVLPFRFGVMYPSLEAVENFLREEGAALRATLGRLENRIEWGLSLQWNGHAKGEPWGASPDVVDLGGAEEGRAYLTGRLRKEAADEEAGRRARHAAIGVHDQLAAIAVDCVVHPHSSSRGKRGKKSEGGRPLFKASYLVQREQVDAFRLAAETALLGADADLGISGELTGPWPAYNFSELSKDSLA